MSKTIVKTLDNWPYLVTGEVEIVVQNDKVIVAPEHLALCRCGLSTNMPFCTGDHRGKFESVVSKK